MLSGFAGFVRWHGALPLYRMAVIVIAVVFAAALWVMLDRTRLGAMIRAGVDDPQMARVVGIRVSQLFTIVFALGAGLAGFAGMIGGPILSVYPGSIRTCRRSHSSSSSSAAPGACSAPSSASSSASSIISARLCCRNSLISFCSCRWCWFCCSARRDCSEGRSVNGPITGRRLAIAVAILALFAVPYAITETYYVNIASQVLLYAIFAIGLNVLVGYAGLVSLGHAGLFGVAAYIVAYLLAAGYGHAFAIFAGLAIGLVATAVFAALALRATGISFIMITLALGEIIWGVAYRWSAHQRRRPAASVANASGAGRLSLDLGEGAFTMRP